MQCGATQDRRVMVERSDRMRSTGEGNGKPLSLEGLTLKLKLQYFGHLTRRVDSLEKTDAGRDWGQEDKGTTENEMARWHHLLDGHEFE